MIGRVGGKQQISLGYGCEQKGVVIHEMLHALGMFFLKQSISKQSIIHIFPYLDCIYRVNFRI